MGVLGVSGPIHQSFVGGLPIELEQKQKPFFKSLWQKRWD